MSTYISVRLVINDIKKQIGDANPNNDKNPNYIINSMYSLIVPSNSSVVF